MAAIFTEGTAVRGGFGGAARGTDRSRFYRIYIRYRDKSLGTKIKPGPGGGAARCGAPRSSCGHRKGLVARCRIPNGAAGAGTVTKGLVEALATLNPEKGNPSAWKGLGKPPGTGGEVKAAPGPLISKGFVEGLGATGAVKGLV